MARTARKKTETEEPPVNGGGGKLNSVVNILARKLQDAIRQGTFTVGEALPSERALMSQYNVSRASVREALRLLSAQELIEVKRGRGGGSFISSPTHDSVIRSLNQFIDGRDIRYVDLVFAREAIEPAAAAQAAIMRTGPKLRALELISAKCEQNVERIDRFVQANLKWHLALVEASENPLFIAFMTAISKALRDATSNVGFDLEIRKSVAKVHWQIYNAIRDQDPEAAKRRMTRHLDAYSEKLASIDLKKAPSSTLPSGPGPRHA